MRRIAIRLGIGVVLLLLALQFALPPFLEKQVENRLTKHGGSASVDLDAVPAARLLFKSGSKLDVTARGITVDANTNEKDAFKQLDGFSNVDIFIGRSTAGPLRINRFTVSKQTGNSYSVTIQGSGGATDVARYAGDRFGGGLGGALAGLAASATLGDQQIPFNATMQIDTSSGSPVASNVNGSVGGFPAGPLAELVANALLSGI